MHGHFELLLRWAQTAISTLTHAKHACRRLFQQQAPPPPCRHAAESKSLRLGITVADSFSYDTGQLCGPLWFDAFVIVGEPIPLATSSNARVPTRKHFTSLSLASTSSSSPISSVSRTTCESVDRRSRHPPSDTRLVSHLLDRSLARKPLVHTSSQSDPQDQPAIPTEAPQRDTVDNKLVSLTAVLPPPAGCEKCSLRGHRNRPRHSRQACRRSFESHCGEALDSRSLGRGRRSPAPRQSRCEMAHSQLGYATFTLRSMRRGGGARYRSCVPSLETRTRRLVLATGRRSERPLCRCQWRTGWQQTTEPASCDIMSSPWALEAAPTTNESTFNAKRSGQRALAEGGTAARWSERCGPRSVHSFVTRGNAERRDDISRS